MLVGDLVSFYAEVARVGRTSVTVNVEVFAERGIPQRAVKVTEATLTYVAMDESASPAAGPPPAGSGNLRSRRVVRGKRRPCSDVFRTGTEAIMKQATHTALLGTASAFSLVMAASTAQAAGFALIEQGASGMGNAFAGAAALGDDATTVFFNPAGMTRLGPRRGGGWWQCHQSPGVVLGLVHAAGCHGRWHQHRRSGR